MFKTGWLDNWLVRKGDSGTFPKARWEVPSLGSLRRTEEAEGDDNPTGTTVSLTWTPGTSQRLSYPLSTHVVEDSLV